MPVHLHRYFCCWQATSLMYGRTVLHFAVHLVASQIAFILIQGFCMQKDFEQLPHTADIKVRVYGDSLKTLFRNAVIGMFQSIGPKIDGCRIEHDRVVCDALPAQHDVSVTGTDAEMVLVEFLSEVLYLSDVHNEAYLDAHIHEVDDTHVKATIHGIGVTGFEVVEIKAVTYHDLKIKDVDGQLQVDIVFDI